MFCERQQMPFLFILSTSCEFTLTYQKLEYVPCSMQNLQLSELSSSIWYQFYIWLEDLWRDGQPCHLDSCPQSHDISQCSILCAIRLLYYIPQMLDWIHVMAATFIGNLQYALEQLWLNVMEHYLTAINCHWWGIRSPRISAWYFKKRTY